MNSSPFGESETDWLVYADYVDERGQSDAAEMIRDEISESESPWNWEYRYRHVVGGGVVVGGVGGE